MGRGVVFATFAALLIAGAVSTAARPEPAVNAGHWAESSDVLSTVSATFIRLHTASLGSCTSTRVRTRHSRESASACIAFMDELLQEVVIKYYLEMSHVQLKNALVWRYDPLTS